MNARAAIAAVVWIVAAAAPAFAGKCEPAFPYAGGWLGGDDAYSVPIDGGRVVWLFADSFVGGAGQTVRAGSRMISNTIAISTCDDGKFSISYYWRDRGAPKPRPFFESSTQYDYWPMDGFFHGGVLYVFLRQIVREKGGDVFGFHGIGVTLARIRNPSEDPARWTIDYLRVASSTTVAPGVAAMVKREYVYLFAVLDDAAHKTQPLILTRVAVDRLDDPASTIEYLAKDGSWKRGLNYKDARIVIDAGATEMSIRYHPELRRWVAIQGKSASLAGEIGFRTSERLDGPWSPWRSLFVQPSRRKDIFCYAAKEHIEFAGPGTALVTYACNLFDFGKLATDMTIYRPQVIRLPLR